MALYDTIGRGYGDRRREEPRIAREIVRGLESCKSVLNVGAGTGSYEPRDRSVVALEPSRVMIRQRQPDAGPVVQGSAAHLPFGDATFDAALAVLTIHHWPDRMRGLEEMRRVARRRVVILTWDPDGPPFWLRDYFPEIWEMDQEIFPTLSELRRALGAITISKVPIPHDCIDGFLGAYWRRPEVYLDAEARSGMSTFARIADVEPALTRLRDDLDSGEWDRRYGSLREQPEIDLGYRLIVSS